MPTILEKIKKFNSDRVPEYTSLKYLLMTQSAFRFFRGTCHLFYEDLYQSNAMPFSPATWTCGDLHLENFGSFKGDNRLVYFDVNDFDEAILAPACFELVRMVSSIFTGFDSFKIPRRESFKMAHLYLHSYSMALSRGKALYIEPEIAKGIVKRFLEKVAHRKQKELISQRTISEKGKLKLRIDSMRLYKVDKPLQKELISYLTSWVRQHKDKRNHYRIRDCAYRIAGTGSIGQKRYVFLVQSRIDPSKYALLDMKQSKPSSVLPFCDLLQPAWASESERIITIQNRMQNVSPAFLSSIQFREDWYILKELQPTEDKIDFGLIRNRVKEVERVIRDMAILTASAQLRSSGRQGAAVADELIAFGQDNQWHQAVLDYAGQYGNQIKKDYRSFREGYRKGYFK